MKYFLILMMSSVLFAGEYNEDCTIFCDSFSIDCRTLTRGSTYLICTRMFHAEALVISEYGRKETKDSSSSFYIVRKLNGDSIIEITDTMWCPTNPASKTSVEYNFPGTEWYDSEYND